MQFVVVSSTKNLAEAFVKGIKVDILDEEETLVIAIQFSTPPGLADMYPVGSTITGTGKAFLFHECFEEYRDIAITLSPIVR